jgi:hypothetical protein
VLGLAFCLSRPPAIWRFPMETTTASSGGTKLGLNCILFMVSPCLQTFPPTVGPSSWKLGLVVVPPTSELCRCTVFPRRFSRSDHKKFRLSASGLQGRMTRTTYDLTCYPPLLAPMTSTPHPAKVNIGQVTTDRPANSPAPMTAVNQHTRVP